MGNRFCETEVVIPRWSGLTDGPRSGLVGISAALPLNLAQVVPVCTLMQWVQDEVAALDWHHPLVQEYLRHHPEPRPQAVLSLLVLAYAMQVFNSQDIITRCHSDRAFAIISEGQIPFLEELTRFRRKNRALITRVLAGVFDRLLQHHYGRSAEVSRANLRDLEAVASVRVDIARHMDGAE